MPAFYANNKQSDELYHYGVLGMKWGVRRANRNYKKANKASAAADSSLRKAKANTTSFFGTDAKVMKNAVSAARSANKGIVYSERNNLIAARHDDKYRKQLSKNAKKISKFESKGEREKAKKVRDKSKKLTTEYKKLSGKLKVSDVKLSQADYDRIDKYITQFNDRIKYTNRTMANRYNDKIGFK